LQIRSEICQNTDATHNIHMYEGSWTLKSEITVFTDFHPHRISREWCD